jgi:hypothetical protein
MPQFDRSEIKAGLRMHGDAIPVEKGNPRHAGIRRDVFLVSDQALAEDVTATKTQAFMSALDLDRLAIAEISRRLQHVKSELEQYNRTKRR